jgi:hypothetical protein
MRMLFALCAAAALAVVAVPASAAPTTVKGEVVEVSCPLLNGAVGHGLGHRQCAIDCARTGAQMGIMTSDGTIYDITGKYAARNNALLLRYIAQQVEATGVVTMQNGDRMMAVATMAVAKP